jgi:carbon storage regulator
VNKQPLMLILSRRVGESLQIGPDIQVTVVAANNGEVRLGIVAPPHVLPAAEEVHERAEELRGKDHISWR